MDAMLHALSGILLRAIPTLLLVVLLNFYLKGVFFKPLERVLHKRYEATEGARKLAQQNLERAAAKTAEYEESMRAARAQLYHSQEEMHRQMQEHHSAVIAEARARAEAAVKAAKAQLAADVAGVKGTLAAQSESLAAEIAEHILGRSAA
jgi:F-type H+-transporting ATPase subunit b